MRQVYHEGRGLAMAFDGSWTLQIESDDIDPEIVPREATLAVATGDDGIAGTMEGPYPMGDGVTITDVTVKGDAVRWKAAMRGERLRPQLLEFSATIDGDAMTGEVEVGIFGTATFSAMRASAST